MQKKSKIIIISVVTAILLIVGVFMAVTIVGADNSAQAVATEKLSLGQKFLLDLEYDKAVAEFQAVIDIEPKNADAYIGLAEAYIGMGDEEKAIETLEKGLSETGDEKIQAKLEELKTPEKTTVTEETTTVETTTTPEVTTTPEETTTTPPETTTVETTTTPEVTTTAKTTPPPEPEDKNVAYTEREDFDDGGYLIHEYNKEGKCLKETVYRSNGEGYGDATYSRFGWWNNEKSKTVEYRFIHFNKCIREFDSNGNNIKTSYYNADGTLDYYYTGEYDSNGNLIKESHYNGDGTLSHYYIYEYDSNGNMIKISYYYPDGTLDYYWINEYDSNGNRIKESRYNPDGTIKYYYIYEYDSNGNKIKESRYNPDGTPM